MIKELDPLTTILNKINYYRQLLNKETCQREIQYLRSKLAELEKKRIEITNDVKSRDYGK